MTAHTLHCIVGVAALAWRWLHVSCWRSRCCAWPSLQPCKQMREAAAAGCCVEACVCFGACAWVLLSLLGPGGLTPASSAASLVVNAERLGDGWPLRAPQRWQACMHEHAYEYAGGGGLCGVELHACVRACAGCPPACTQALFWHSSWPRLLLLQQPQGACAAPCATFARIAQRRQECSRRRVARCSLSLSAPPRALSWQRCVRALAYLFGCDMQCVYARYGW